MTIQFSVHACGDSSVCDFSGNFGSDRFSPLSMGKRKAGENSEEPQAKVSKAAKAKAGAAKAEPRAKAEPKAKVEPAPKAEPKAEPKRLSRSKSKVSSSIAPLLDAENDAAALASSTGQGIVPVLV